MNTTDLVNILTQVNPDITRPQALTWLNYAQNILAKIERDSAIYYDTTTGDLPYLATIAGTYSYTINTNTVPIWQVAYIVVDSLGALPSLMRSGDDTWMSRLYSLPGVFRYTTDSIWVKGREYNLLIQVSSPDLINEGNAPSESTTM